MFVLWSSGGDCEEGRQEEIGWKIDINKHEDTVSEVSSETRTALSEMSHSLEVKKAKLEGMQDCFAHNVITMCTTLISMQTPRYQNCSPSKKQVHRKTQNL